MYFSKLFSEGGQESTKLNIKIRLLISFTWSVGGEIAKEAVTAHTLNTNTFVVTIDLNEQDEQCVTSSSHCTKVRPKTYPAYGHSHLSAQSQAGLNGH